MIFIQIFGDLVNATPMSLRFLNNITNLLRVVFFLFFFFCGPDVTFHAQPGDDVNWQSLLKNRANYAQ